jgi:hypothetical protein
MVLLGIKFSFWKKGVHTNDLMTSILEEGEVRKKRKK